MYYKFKGIREKEEEKYTSNRRENMREVEGRGLLMLTQATNVYILYEAW